MALKTRIRLLKLTKLALLSVSAVVLVLVGLAYAGEAPQAISQVGIMWQVIVSLFGVLNFILTGIIIWIIGNQKETFQRIGTLETGEEVRKELCNERHPKK